MVIKFTCVFFFLSIPFANAQFYTLQFQENIAVSITVNTQSEFTVKRKGNDRAILGKYHQQDDSTRFTPYLPFGLGQEYELWLSRSKKLTFTPSLDLEDPKIVKIFPQQTSLPANILKFYLVFDQPMARINPYQNISIWKNGAQLENAILDLDPALWDETGTILTVWLEPGRIKSDLGPNRQLGKILEKGDEIIVKADGLRAENGLLMKEEFRKAYQVIEEDRKKPALTTWNLSLPASDTKQPLQINFLEAMDYLSSVSSFSVRKSEQEIRGIYGMKSDSLLIFHPENKWESGSYTLEVEEGLEDLAANNLLRLFEEDLNQKSASADTSSFQKVFTIE